MLLLVLNSLQVLSTPNLPCSPPLAHKISLGMVGIASELERVGLICSLNYPVSPNATLNSFQSLNFFLRTFSHPGLWVVPARPQQVRPPSQLHPGHRSLHRSPVLSGCYARIMLICVRLFPISAFLLY